MGQENKPNQNDLYTARIGVYTQLSAIPMLVEYAKENGGGMVGMEKAVNHFGMKPFIENQIAVIACYKMWDRINSNIIHSLTHEEK
jgi:hypothetical protein